MDIKTETKTTIQSIVSFQDGCFKIPVHISYDGQEERFKNVNFEREIEKLDIPKGEYKVTITLEKI